MVQVNCWRCYLSENQSPEEWDLFFVLGVPGFSMDIHLNQLCLPEIEIEIEKLKKIEKLKN